MGTTIILKDDLVAEAAAATNITEKAALIHAGLRELIAKHARERLIALGGSDPQAQAAPRRRQGKRKNDGL